MFHLAVRTSPKGISSVSQPASRILGSFFSSSASSTTSTRSLSTTARLERTTDVSLDVDRVQTTIDNDGIARVVLNRPNKLNACDLKMFEAVAATAAKLREDRRLRAVIVSGKGRAFSTGLDVVCVTACLPALSY